MAIVPLRKSPRIVRGSSIEGIYTNNNFWDSWIELYDKDGIHYRLNARELFKVIKKLKFITEKKRVHTWLHLEGL